MDVQVSSLLSIKTPPFFFDEEKAEELVLTLYSEYVNKSGLYQYENASTAPQNKHIPGMKFPTQYDVFETHKHVEEVESVKIESPTRSLWTFFATLTDRRQVSDEVYKAHVRLHAEYPELYTQKVLEKDVALFGEFLAKYKIGVPRQSAEYWIRCAKTLFEEFDGDPIKLINHCGGTVEGVQLYKKEVEKQTGFDPLPGYGPKITSLLLLFLAELGLYEMPEDAFPVDVHVQALFLQYGAMTQTGVIANDGAEIFLRPFLCRMATKHTLCKVALSHAFWIKGAKLCTGCSKRKYVHLLCSIEKECLGRITTEKYYSEGIWEYPLRFMRKGSSSELSIKEGPLFK